MAIVFKCEDPNCKYPDTVIADPMDDHVYCACGKMARGHFKNTPKETVQIECEWCGSKSYVMIDDGYSWPYSSCCGGN